MFARGSVSRLRCKRTLTNLSTGELTHRSGLTALSPLRVLSTLNISELMITLTVSRSHAVNALVK